MRIVCDHGYFRFFEDKKGEASRFESLFNVSLARMGEFFVFEKQSNAPEYSVKGNTFLDFMATATFAGSVSQILEASGYVFDFLNDMHVPLTSITRRVSLNQSSNYYFVDGLIQPGMLWNGTRITGYTCHFDFSDRTFLYSEVTSVG